MRLVKCILNLVIFGSNSFKYVDIPSFAFFFFFFLGNGEGVQLVHSIGQ